MRKECARKRNHLLTLRAMKQYSGARLEHRFPSFSPAVTVKQEPDAELDSEQHQHAPLLHAIVRTPQQFSASSMPQNVLHQSQHLHHFQQNQSHVFLHQVQPQHQVIVSTTSSPVQMHRGHGYVQNAEWAEQSNQVRNQHVVLPPAQTQAVMSKMAELSSGLTPATVQDGRRQPMLVQSASVGSIIANRRGVSSSTAQHRLVREHEGQPFSVRETPVQCLFAFSLFH